MNPDKYGREIALNCPVCGGTQFEYGNDVEAAHAQVRCATCDRVTTKDELINENSENISEHVLEIKKEIVKDAAKELKMSLKKAFRGSKNIKIT